MKVGIYTTTGCPRCMLLKQKLEIMGVEFTVLTEPPPGIDENTKLPITIIEGVPYEYAAAMRKLKEIVG